ncbi:MAG: universal stress protein [Bacteroidales bacterium]|jgi:nucleotide-binding universal stress UspA family protein
MEVDSKIIVVPWDFTPVTEYALQHAVKISRMTHNDVCLLHIVEKITTEGGIKAKQAAMTIKGNEIERKYGVTVKTHVQRGTIFKQIPEFVNDRSASLVVMGTHGMNGMQKLTGSWALKVIAKSRVPFIVVQAPPADMEKFRIIVCPIDWRAEEKEKLSMAIFMSKYFDTKVHILKATRKDESLAKKANLNLNFTVRMLIQNNIEYEIREVPSDKLGEQTIEIAQQLNADLILIMTTKDITFADYVVGAKEQYIIANSQKIPVCCVNPSSSFANIGQFMYG